MAVKLRLARHGRKKRPFYRLVAADSEMRRDGRFLELLGTVDPLIDPPRVLIKEDRVKYWVGVGAQPSDTVASIIDREFPGYLSTIEDARKEKIRSQRSRRKERGKQAA